VNFINKFLKGTKHKMSFSEFQTTLYYPLVIPVNIFKPGILIMKHSIFFRFRFYEPFRKNQGLKVNRF